MNKFFLIICAVLCVSISLFSQAPNDVIITKSREQISVKVIKVGNDEVEYRKADNTEGPIYTILKKDVASIVYANGAVDVFEEAQSESSSSQANSFSQSAYTESDFTDNQQKMEYVNKTFYLNGTPIPKQEAGNMIGTASYQGFEFWRKAKRNSGWGWALFGLAMFDYTLAIVNYAAGNNGTLALIEGAAFTVGSVVCLSRVEPARKMAVKCYNDAMIEKRKTANSLYITPASEGIGLALHF